MLKLQEVNLVEGLILVTIEEPTINNKVNGILKTEEVLDKERRGIRLRIATIISIGELPLSSSSLKGNSTEISQNNHSLQVGMKVIVPIDLIEKWDLPIEGYPNVAFLKADYIISAYNEVEFTPIPIEE